MYFERVVISCYHPFTKPIIIVFEISNSLHSSEGHTKIHLIFVFLSFYSTVSRTCLSTFAVEFSFPILFCVLVDAIVNPSGRYSTSWCTL